MARTWTDSQQDAMNLRGRLLVVSAAAGSGKTSVLTERIIRMLTDRANPAELSRMLIVTFTRAAAAELKSRIAAALGDALAADPGNAHLSRQVLELGSAHISTIDAFFGEEVRAGFAQLGLPPAFRIADETELDELALPLMEDTLSELYDTYATTACAATDDPFARLRDNRFAGLMDHLLANRRNDALPAQLWNFYRRFANYPEGLALLSSNADELRRAAATDFFASLPGRTVRKTVSVRCRDTLQGLEAVLQALAGCDLLPKYEGCIRADLEFCRSLLAACGGECYDTARAAVFSPRQAASGPRGKACRAGGLQSPARRAQGSRPGPADRLFCLVRRGDPASADAACGRMRDAADPLFALLGKAGRRKAAARDAFV